MLNVRNEHYANSQCISYDINGTVDHLVSLKTSRLQSVFHHSADYYYIFFPLGSLKITLLYMESLSLPLIQEGQLSVSGERMCTILVNRLED